MAIPAPLQIARGEHMESTPRQQAGPQRAVVDMVAGDQLQYFVWQSVDRAHIVTGGSDVSLGVHVGDRVWKRIHSVPFPRR